METVLYLSVIVFVCVSKWKQVAWFNLCITLVYYTEIRRGEPHQDLHPSSPFPALPLFDGKSTVCSADAAGWETVRGQSKNQEKERER